MSRSLRTPDRLPHPTVFLTHLRFCCYPNLDDARGRHQKKIRSKTQHYLNLYAMEGLRTLCIAKRVSGLRARPPGCGRRPRGTQPALSRRC